MNLYKINKMNYSYISNFDLFGLIGGNDRENNKKEIYFIRHGETNWNLQGISQGKENDIPLNSNGINQAIKTGIYLETYRTADIQFDCILSSPLKRAKKTAKLIANELHYDKSNIIYLDQLIENSMGIFSGLTDHDEPRKTIENEMKELISKLKDPIEKYQLKNYKNAEEFYKPKLSQDTGFDTYESLKKRMDYIINYINNSNYKKIIIISHGNFLNTLLSYIFRTCVLPKGNMTNGNNCWISYCVCQNKKYYMISPMNTEHFSLQI